MIKRAWLLGLARNPPKRPAVVIGLAGLPHLDMDDAIPTPVIISTLPVLRN